MTFELGFLESALKEWHKLDANTREQFKKKLAERLETPRVPSAKLSGSNDRYKIKLRNIGYRLVYEVHDTEVIVVVVAVGRRDRNAVYKAADKRHDTSAAIEAIQEARATQAASSGDPVVKASSGNEEPEV
jgi:mRNA interferase RelE/StbE